MPHPAPQKGRPSLGNPEFFVNDRDRREAEGEIKAAYKALYAVFDQSRRQDSPFPGAEPSDSARRVCADGHAGHGLDSKVAVDEAVVRESGDVGAPEEVTDDMVLAHERGEMVYAFGERNGLLSKDGIASGIGGIVKVRLAKHVALANYAGRNSDRVDGAVELGVRSRHEHLLESSAAVGPRSREHRRGHTYVAST
ncbi:hypothetical protein RRF57_009257 [Xylaria bambusicola]|uniref:Uncharacterized protein n=1 Tax=Xylaria bambusicola TaxID=326684 RepID=A0AAN7UUN8_9PEZI